MKIIRYIKNKLKIIYYIFLSEKYPHITSTSIISRSSVIYNKENLYLEEHAGFGPRSVIMNTRAKFIMKKGSGAAFGLTVVTGNHMSVVGMKYMDVTNEIKDKLDKVKKYDRDIIVEEDVWIGSNVTLLSGSHIGRGCHVGSGSVVRGKIPPYAVVIGNPARLVGFVFTPEEVKEHEEQIYPKCERISLEQYENNYQKYFLDNVQSIKKYITL